MVQVAARLLDRALLRCECAEHERAQRRLFSVDVGQRALEVHEDLCRQRQRERGGQVLGVRHVAVDHAVQRARLLEPALAALVQGRQRIERRVTRHAGGEIGDGSGGTGRRLGRH